ncbi:MAG: tetratricopeptide repeat protein [Acidobacteriota bacterium]|nr:MAG: tetratricopeptide repeat protein [Acidobacteriota bacterium]
MRIDVVRALVLAGLLSIGSEGVAQHERQSGAASPPQPAQAQQGVVADQLQQLDERPQGRVVMLNEEAKRRLEQLEREAHQNPSDAMAQARYGRALIAVGQIQEGLASFARARAIAPDDPEVLLLYAKGLWKAGRTDEAIDLALRVSRSALASNKLASEAFFVAGEAITRRGDPERGEAYLVQAIERDPDNPGPLLNLGLRRLSQRDMDDALNLINRAAKSDPDNVRVQSTLAQTLEIAGMEELALEAWTRVADLVPGDPNVRVKLGSAYLVRGEHETAAKHFEKGISLTPGDANLHLLYGEALLYLGRLDEAAEQAEKAKQLGADVSFLMQEIAQARWEASLPAQD